ncbi:MAG: ABC transporter substrate-binding protein, partial [Pseudomonadota bacterium]
IRRNEGIPLHAALDQIASSEGFQNWSDLSRRYAEGSANQASKAVRRAVGIATLSASIATSAFGQEMRSYVDALDRTVEIPVDPQRIHAERDHTIAMPLIELEANLVSTVGRYDSEGELFIRAADRIFGTTFENSGLLFVGNPGQTDFEAVAAARPDLIVMATDSYDQGVLSNFEAIAPTVVLNSTTQPALDYYRDLADVAGRLDSYQAGLAKYEALIGEARGWLGEPDHTYTKFIVLDDGEIVAFSSYGALSIVLEDLGFEMVGPGAELRDAGTFAQRMSIERIQDFDADYIFDTFQTAAGDGPQSPFERIEAVLPNYCELLTACAEGRHIALMREHAFPVSFFTLEANVHYLVHSIGAQQVD